MLLRPDRGEVEEVRRVDQTQWSRGPAAVKVLAVSICAAALVLGAYSFLFGG
jgi:hypothetical protein